MHMEIIIPPKMSNPSFSVKRMEFDSSMVALGPQPRKLWTGGTPITPRMTQVSLTHC